MNTAPEIRLHLFFARDCHLAVILRQGPSKVFRMILWDRNGDRFEDGQWLKHKVYVERCHLSHDGQHFLYFALNGKWGEETDGSYSAICRPPYFTALALYPQGETWGGGGRFISRFQYIIDTGSRTDNDIIGRADGLERVWEGQAIGDNVTGLVREDGSRARLPREIRQRFLNGDSWTPPMDQYGTVGGRLYRHAGGEMELIRDFSNMEFESIRAPYDWRETNYDEAKPTHWHPLDGEET